MSTEKHDNESGRDLLTVGEVANKLNISERFVWKLANTDSTFPKPVHIGASARWRPGEIEVYIAELTT